MKKYFTIILCSIFFTLINIPLKLNGQSKKDTLLVFNNKLIFENGQYRYPLEDILATDTLKTNINNLSIISCSLSSNCSVDWEVKCINGIISKFAKDLIKKCLPMKNKLYIDNIILLDNKTNNQIKLKSKIIIVQINK